MHSTASRVSAPCRSAFQRASGQRRKGQAFSAATAHRRDVALLPLASLLLGLPANAEEATDESEQLAKDALEAYNAKDLYKAWQLYSKLVSLEPEKPVWLERRGQVQVDRKQFKEAILDFNAAEACYQRTVDPKYVSLGLVSNRALAHEGLDEWTQAIADYDKVRPLFGLQQLAAFLTRHCGLVQAENCHTQIEGRLLCRSRAHDRCSTSYPFATRCTKLHPAQMRQHARALYNTTSASKYESFQGRTPVQALMFAGELGFNIPYVLNSRGNCYSSLATLVRSLLLLQTSYSPESWL